MYYIFGCSDLVCTIEERLPEIGKSARLGPFLRVCRQLHLSQSKESHSRVQVGDILVHAFPLAVLQAII